MKVEFDRLIPLKLTVKVETLIADFYVGICYAILQYLKIPQSWAFGKIMPLLVIPTKNDFYWKQIYHLFERQLSAE